jgi:hypothetical protein
MKLPQVNNMDYRMQRQTCRFCEFFDIAKDAKCYKIICRVTGFSVDDGGVCNYWREAKDAK